MMDEDLADIPVDELLQEGLEPSSLPTVDAVTSGSNLIDATQNAIIDTAENVTQVFDSAEKITPLINSEPFYTKIEFWVGVAFILTVLLLLKPLIKFIATSLNNRIKNVLDNMAEAVKLRDDAQNILADYERKFANTTAKQAQIEAETQQNLQNIKRDETAKMANAFKIKENELHRNLQAEIEKVRQELNAGTSERAIKIAQKAISGYLHTADKSSLIDDAINELKKFAK